MDTSVNLDLAPYVISDSSKNKRTQSALAQKKLVVGIGFLVASISFLLWASVRVNSEALKATSFPVILFTTIGVALATVVFFSGVNKIIVALRRLFDLKLDLPAAGYDLHLLRKDLEALSGVPAKELPAMNRALNNPQIPIIFSVNVDEKAKTKVNYQLLVSSDFERMELSKVSKPFL